MYYIKANLKDVERITTLIRETIYATYSKYYTEEVVEFFVEHHRAENIEKDIKENHVWLLLSETKELVGTGSYAKNHVTRLYIAPKHQRKGYGSYIMDQLEAEIAKDYNCCILDASLPASQLYEKRGYHTIKHDQYEVANDAILVYEIMEKPLSRTGENISYNGRVFTIKENTANGEVDDNTIFHYHQQERTIWAEYEGGEIEKGFLIGTVKEEGKLEFTYQHLNKQGEMKLGNCTSYPHILSNGKLEMYESWQWMSGDQSKGISILREL